MKKTIYLLLAFVSLAVAACGPKVDPQPKPDPDPDPVFPSVVEKVLSPGQSVTISFNANLDWEASIPTNLSTYFYIDDNGVPAYKVKGQKGSATVKICTIAVEGDFSQHDCALSLKMGGKTQTIAKITIKPEDRSITVFAAKKNEYGLFIPTGDGGYEYQTSAASSLLLEWPDGLSSYTLPIRVDANFQWSVTMDYPKWMDLSVTSSKDESTPVVIKGVSTEYPLDDAEGKLTFIDPVSGTTVLEMPITIKGCKDKIEFDCETYVIDLNILGEYNLNGSWVAEGCPATLTATLDSEVIPVEVYDGKFSYNPSSWVKIDYSFPHQDPTADVVQERICHVRAGQNNSADREAVLLAIPGYILSTIDLEKDLFNSDRSAINDRFKAYVCASVRQVGLDPTKGWGVISPVNNDVVMAVNGGGMERTQPSDNSYARLFDKYGCDEIYTVLYNNQYSSEYVDIAITEDYDNVFFAGRSGQETQSDSNVEFVVPSGNSKLFRLNIQSFEDNYETCLVLRSGNKVKALVICRMSSTYWPMTDYRDIYFTMIDVVKDDKEMAEEMLPKNVELFEVKSGEIYEKYARYGIPVWKLVYQDIYSARNAMLYVPPFQYMNAEAIEINPAQKWISMESGVTDQSGQAKAYIHVSMNQKYPEEGNEGYIVLKGAGRPVFVLICERTFM